MPYPSVFYMLSGDVAGLSGHAYIKYPMRVLVERRLGSARAYHKGTDIEEEGENDFDAIKKLVETMRLLHRFNTEFPEQLTRKQRRRARALEIFF